MASAGLVTPTRTVRPFGKQRILLQVTAPLLSLRFIPAVSALGPQRWLRVGNPLQILESDPHSEVYTGGKASVLMCADSSQTRRALERGWEGSGTGAGMTTPCTHRLCWVPCACSHYEARNGPGRGAISLPRSGWENRDWKISDETLFFLKRIQT